MRPWPLFQIALVGVLVVLLSIAAATSVPGALVAVGLPLVVILCCLPVWCLPSVALVTFALVPVGYLVAVPQFVGRFLTPTVLVLLIWLIRTRGGASEARRQRVVPRRSALVGCALLLTLLLVALARISVNPLRSYLWVAVFVLVCVLPALRGGRVDPRTVPALVKSWFRLGCGLGLVAMVESLAQYNPLTRYYSIDQHWSVYRVTTLLGHPLMNGTFFALTGCLALFTAIRGGSIRPLATVTFVLSSIAAALTGSRSGVYALVVGLAVGLLVLMWSRQVKVAAKLTGVGLALLAVLVLPNMPVLAARAGSAEAEASRIYRTDIIRLTYRLLIAHPVFGGGPGTSAILANQAGATLPLESAILGTLVSLGIVGCAGLLVFLFLLAVSVIRKRRLEALAGLAAFLVAGAAFPLWETNPGSWALLGLVALIGGESPGRTPTTEAARPVLAASSVATRERVATCG